MGASANLDIAAQKELETYKVPLSLGDGRVASVGLRVREEPALCGKRAFELKQIDKLGAPTESSSPLSPEKNKAMHDTRAYAKEHNLTQVIQEMLQHILRERPDAPYSVMASYFKRKAEDMGEQPQDIIPNWSINADLKGDVGGELERLQ